MQLKSFFKDYRYSQRNTIIRLFFQGKSPPLGMCLSLSMQWLREYDRRHRSFISAFQAISTDAHLQLLIMNQQKGYIQNAQWLWSQQYYPFESYGKYGMDMLLIELTTANEYTFVQQGDFTASDMDVILTNMIKMGSGPLRLVVVFSFQHWKHRFKIKQHAITIIADNDTIAVFDPNFGLSLLRRHSSEFRELMIALTAVYGAIIEGRYYLLNR
ncbi:YopT-type cysteine protease domain-containing protein [Enterobacteriaceae bacterium LUAb1]